MRTYDRQRSTHTHTHIYIDIYTHIYIINATKSFMCIHNHQAVQM